MQISRQQTEAAKFGGRQRRQNRTKGQQSVGSGVFHVRAVLVAVLPIEHPVRRVPERRLSGARPRDRSLPLAGIRVVDDKPDHLHDIQQNVQSRVHQVIEMTSTNRVRPERLSRTTRERG